MNTSSAIPRLLAAVLMLAASSQAQNLPQTLSLQTGWNSVWLETQPDEPNPAVLFAGKPVEMVTTFFPLAAKYTSLRDPNSDTWKETEWRTWQPETAPGAFLNNLHQLTAGQGYLIKAAAAAMVTISGKARLHRLEWRPQSFNLVGLPVDPASPATLGAFFANSPAHTPLRAFRLVNGKWVQAASAEPVQAGRAYWIWCGTGSDHQGPVSLRASSGGLTLNTADSQGSVELRPAGASALTVAFNASGSVPLARLTSASRVSASTAFSVIAPASEWTPVRFGLLDPGVAPGAGVSLLEIRAAGLLWRVPVTSNP